MELPVELFLALRYLNPRRSFLAAITVLSISGVTISVAVLIVVLSVMGGFREELEKRIIGFNVPITVAMADGAVLYDADKAIEIIKQEPDVTAAGVFVRGPVLIKHGGKISPAYIKSVPEEGDDPVLPLQKYVKMGEYELRGDSVIVGSEWSKRNSALPGDEIEIYGPALLNAIAQQQPGKNVVIPSPETPIVRGIFQTGQYDYDLNFFLVSTEMAQHLYGLGEGVHGIAVRIKDPSQAEAVKQHLNDILPPKLRARTWMDDNEALFGAILVERMVMTVILLFVMLVASFGLCGTLITVTVQKSREIGLMKALGANDLQVSRVFLFHSLLIAVMGVILGIAGGLAVLQLLNPFRAFMLRAFRVEVFNGTVYGLPEIPTDTNPLTIVLIAISAIVFCVLAALFPALSAAKLAPARALRYE